MLFLSKTGLCAVALRVSDELNWIELNWKKVRLFSSRRIKLIQLESEFEWKWIWLESELKVGESKSAKWIQDKEPQYLVE